MRWEAHFSIFKGKKWGSFKNIALSMANYHQLRMCYSQLGMSGTRNLNYLYGGHEIEVEKKVNLDIFPDYVKTNVIELFESLHEDIYLAKKIHYHGHHLKPGSIISSSNERHFNLISGILVRNENIVLLMNASSEEKYKNILNAYEVKFTDDIICKKIQSLSRPFPLHGIYQNNKTYLVNPYTCVIHEEV